MPIYEYWCHPCKKKFEVLILRPSSTSQSTCPGCGGSDLKRLISRVVSIKSEEARLEALADPSNLSGLDENDPASMARWVKRMGRELGEEVSGEEIDQMADEIASGKGLDAGGSDDGIGGGDTGAPGAVL